MYQLELIQAACSRGTVKGILAQKPLALNYADAVQAVRCCEQAGIQLSMNQNMRYDPSVYAANILLQEGDLGAPIFATIDMRGVPHWKPWQAETGSATLRVMSIHHLDCMRYWFGDPERVFCSTRPDPRTGFPHTDGICTTILEYENGLRCVVIDDVWTGPVRKDARATSVSSGALKVSTDSPSAISAGAKIPSPLPRPCATHARETWISSTSIPSKAGSLMLLPGP